MLDLNQEVVFDDQGDSHAVASLAGDEYFGSLLRAPGPQDKPLKRGLNYSHDAMIDAIIANPAVSQNALAETFGYSVSWISQIVNSDAFKSRLAERAHELRDPLVLASMEEQFAGVLARGLEITREKLAKPAEQVSDNFVLRTMELSSRALGYGAKKDESGKATNVEEKLADLSNNLVGLLKQQKRNAITLDAE